MYLVRRVRPGLSHWRHLRVHPQAAVRRGSAAHPRQGGPLGLPLLRGRLPARPARQGQRPHAGDVALDRGGDAQPGLHLRKGTVRVRLPPASRPAHGPADPQRVDATTMASGPGPASGRDTAKDPGSPSRRWVGGRSRGHPCVRSGSRRSPDSTWSTRTTSATGWRLRPAGTAPFGRPPGTRR